MVFKEDHNRNQKEYLNKIKLGALNHSKIGTVENRIDIGVETECKYINQNTK